MILKISKLLKEMKIRWSKPFEKQFYSGDKIPPTNNSNQNLLNEYKFDLRNDFNRYKNSSSLNLNDNNINKRLLNDRPIEKSDKTQLFISVEEYVFYFKNSEIFIMEFLDKINKEEKNEVKNSLEKENSFNSNNAIKQEEYPFSEFLLNDIKKINFLAYDENIVNCILNKNNHNISLSSDFGMVYIINISLMDFFVEVIFSFNIKQNYLYSYEILYFCENNNILLTLDNNLYICEIYQKKKNQPTQVFKNCLFKCEYMDEKILHAEKLDNLVSVFTNKAIYMVDFYDMSSSIFYKKEKVNNYAGKMNDGNIYFIKDENTYAVYSILDKDKKLSFKLSSKNQLNVLNFSRVLYVDKEIMIIANGKNTEIYLISLITFKIINRESILFDNPIFIVYCNYNEDKKSNSIDIDRMINVFSLNEINFDIKYKIGYIKNNKVESANDKISDSILTHQKSKIYSQEEELVKTSYDDNYNDLIGESLIPQKNSEFINISYSVESLITNKKMKKKYEDREFYELKEYEANYIEERYLQQCVSNKIKKIKSYISFFLKITKHDKYFKIYKVQLTYEIFKKAINQIRLFIELYFYTSDLLISFKKYTFINYILLIENKIKMNWIAGFRSYSLNISKKISDEFVQMILKIKLESILGLCIKINDTNTYNQINMTSSMFIKFVFKNKMIELLN